MKKVVAFLEQYAEWLAMGLAVVFLLYMVYDNVVAPDAIRTKVGAAAVLPGDVDPTLNQNVISQLQQKIDAPAGNLQGAFDVKDATAEFYAAMGPKRPRMDRESLLAAGVRPPLPGTTGMPTEGPGSEFVLDKLPSVPAATPTSSATGNSLVAQADPIVPPGGNGADQPVQPAPANPDPAAMLASAI